MRRRGFTLIELLVVISIIVLISAAALPMVMPALADRKVSAGARTLHAALAGARDAAVRAGEPRGVRLIPDPQFPGPNPLAAARMVAIEPAPDHTEGRVVVFPWAFPNGAQVIVAAEVRARTVGGATEVYPPAGWYWHIRQGDKIRVGRAGHLFTVAGPILSGRSQNPDRYVNVDLEGADPYISLPVGATTPPGYTAVNRLAAAPWSIPATLSPTPGVTLALGEILLLTNGRDDDGDGWIDEGFDGIDNDGDGIVDPGYNGIDDGGPAAVDDPLELAANAGGEYEPERLPVALAGGISTPSPYVIHRRPVVSERAQEVVLPADVVVDLTSWDAATPERSRLSVDPVSHVVDLLITPNGQVVPASADLDLPPFLHFWITEREDVRAWSSASVEPLRLPIPPNLRASRRLVTVHSRTGRVASNSIEDFDAADPNAPYRAAQSGVSE